jgi:hypothetical protein
VAIRAICEFGDCATRSRRILPLTHSHADTH